MTKLVVRDLILLLVGVVTGIGIGVKWANWAALQLFKK